MKHAQKTSARSRGARIRINVNRKQKGFTDLRLLPWIAIIALELMLVVPTALAQKLVIADGEPVKGSVWTTTITAAAKPNATQTETVRVFDRIGTGITLTVPVGGGDHAAGTKEKPLGGWFAQTPFTLADAPTNADVETTLTYSDTAGSRASFTLGPIGFIDGSRVANVGPLVSNDTVSSFVTVFPDPAAPLVPKLDVNGKPILVNGEPVVWRPTHYTVLLFDARNPLLPPVAETFSGAAPIAQHRIQAKGVFCARVQLGVPQWGCHPRSCTDYGRTWGFASRGSLDGGTFRPFPF